MPSGYHCGGQNGFRSDSTTNKVHKWEGNTRKEITAQLLVLSSIVKCFSILHKLYFIHQYMASLSLKMKWMPYYTELVSQRSVFFLSWCPFLVLSLLTSVICVSTCFYSLYFYYLIPCQFFCLTQYQNPHTDLSTCFRSTSGQWGRTSTHSFFKQAI